LLYIITPGFLLTIRYNIPHGLELRFMTDGLIYDNALHSNR